MHREINMQVGSRMKNIEQTKHKGSTEKLEEIQPQQKFKHQAKISISRKSPLKLPTK
jgi:hypothetical protein